MYIPIKRKLIVKAERGEKSEQTPYEVLIDYLKEDYDSKLLDSETVFEIPPVSQSDQCMASYFNVSEGVIQELRVIIKSGKNIYPVIDATVLHESANDVPPYSTTVTIVAKCVPEQRAEVVDISRKRGRLDVGRGVSTVPDSIPRNQFTVIQAIDRSIGIVDHSSQDGTVVYTKKKINDSEQEKSIDHSLWSVKSAELKEAVASYNN